MKHFKLEEFECPDCKKNTMNQTFLDMIDNAREIAGIPFKINSGYRCAKHNKAVKGVPNSSHRQGLAADIAVNTTTKDIIINALKSAGFKRIGIASTFVHADVDDTKSPSIWYY